MVALAVTFGAKDAFAWTPEKAEWNKDFRVVADEADLVAAVTDATNKYVNVLRIYFKLKDKDELTLSRNGAGWQAINAWLGGGAKSDGALAIVAGLKEGESGDDGARYKITFTGEKQRLFNFNDGVTESKFHARFVGITFRDCKADYGAAVYADATASFYGCTFLDCEATEDGGAIYRPGDVCNQNEDRRDRSLFCGRGIAVEKCTFTNCKADDYGGAIWGCCNDTARWYDNIWDSTFDNCTANTGDGGAIYCAYEGIYRCKFKVCKAPSGHGGAMYGCGHYDNSFDSNNPWGIRECLFVDCTAKYGAAISNSRESHSRVYNCTFITCTAMDSTKGALYDRDLKETSLFNSLFYGCEIGDLDFDEEDDAEEGSDDIYKRPRHNAVVSSKDYFYNFDGGDYHFNIEGHSESDLKLADSVFYYKKDKEIVETDIEGEPWKSSSKFICGCYRYYTKGEWQDYLYNKKEFEYETGCDPLLVTTASDSNDHKDGVVSFREACEYYGKESIRKKSSHQNEIKFQLSGNSPTITLNDHVQVEATDADLLVNGGDLGITLQSESGIGFYGGDRRVFKNVTVKAHLWGDNPWIGFEFVNCAFKGGATANKSGRVGTYVADGGDINWKFERCSFSGYTAVAHIVEMGEKNTTATFDACTFTGNSPTKALILGVGKAVNFRNCTFFDNSSPTMVSSPGAPYPSENYYNCIVCRSKPNSSANLYNTAVSDTHGEVFASDIPLKKTVDGVEQIGFEPKHKGTARGVDPSSPYWSQIPERDIFGNKNPSTRFASQGSYFVIDKEDPSLVVTVPWDYSDEYDDNITLREALTYAADPANKHIIVGATIRPIFDEAAEDFKDGNIVVTLDKTLRLSEDIFASYPLELQPGEGQTLTITAPNTDDAAFRIADGMKMRVKDTTFKSCKGGTDGGAIKSYGQLMVDGCRFENCESSGWGGALYFSKTAQAFVYGTTITGCKADIGGAIANWGGDLVTICVTLTGNEAEIGSAVCSSGASRTLFANATIANNKATDSGGGAFCVDGENAGLINSIVAGNKNGNLAGEWTWAPTSYNKFATGNWCAYSLTDGELADIFLTANAIPTNMPNGVTQLYYPLSSTSAARNGAFVFTKGGLNDKGEVVVGSWPEKVGYSTDIDGYSPLPRELNGAAMGDKYGANFNGYASRDLTGALIMPKDTGMGAMPSFSADVIDASSLVDTLEDVVSDTDGKVSLREAVDYAMAHGGQVNFAPSIFSPSDPVFRLENQIVVPEGCSFELKAPGDHRITLLATATGGNRFFRVEDGGTLKLEGVTMGYGTARGIYGLMSPADDSNGGAVCGVASVKANGEKKMSDLSFVNCAFFDNKAPKGCGGAIYAEGLLSLTDCVFIGNSAGKEGGAVYSKEATMTMTGCEVTNNIAEVNGGGVGIYPGGVTNVIKNSKISGNVAGKMGGGLFCDDGKPTGCVTLTDADIKGNTADTGLYADPDVFSGTGYAFDEQYILRVNRKYYEVLTDEFGVKRVELSEKAAPVLGSIDLGAAATSGKATVKVSNVIPNLEYGLGHAETPVGPYVVDKWQRATSEADLELEAPAEGAGGFYRVMAREVK